MPHRRDDPHTGSDPEVPGAWGWHGGSPLEEGRALGQRIGWVNRCEVYPEATACVAAAQEMGQRLGEPLPVTGRRLTQRLFEAGLLVSRDETRNSNTRRVMADGSPQTVQHFALITFGGGDTPTLDDAVDG